MVLLSAAICTKAGKPIVARQFMEISRSRVEGLLTAFPKLRGSDDQHTFVETDAVRYVYQPMEQLYMVLITTKNSNILEDLETLRLFANVVPEFCKVMTESEVAQQAFELIFAFDEIIALGYRENVNLSQVRTFTQMESHDENIYKMVQRNKEREAKEHMKRKAKELQVQRKERERQGLPGFSAGGGPSSPMPVSMSSSSSSAGPSSAASSSAQASSASGASSAQQKRAGRGMKLGGKAKSSDFVDALIAEGEHVAPVEAPLMQKASHGSSMAASAPKANTESIHVKVEEKITLEASRDGGLEHMEVKGSMCLVVSDPERARVQLKTSRSDKPANLQTHPNLDKKLFTSDGLIRLKAAERPFPLNSEVGVLKWRLQSTDEGDIPLLINCWPNANGDGSVDVNIDYELRDSSLQLKDVVIAVPLPATGGNPVVASNDGQYEVDSRHRVLRWCLPLIEAGDTAEGSIEFSMSSGSADEFFPVRVEFSSSKTYIGITIDAVESVDGGALPFSSEVNFGVESFEFV